MASVTTPLLGRAFPTPRFLWRTGAVLAAAGIVAGAFGTHGLRSRVTPDKLQAWTTASQYAIFNGIALLAVSMHPRFGYHKFAGPAIALGSVLFSGSIIGLVFDKEGRYKFLGPITPLGGSIMIAGYIALAI
ncbi:DUF423-domain-containing protein [Sistotremastrum niveocremeum HHB9708]|uniref:DUF423-domain-containing protein n=1 Tax=Sistotremastrum niveocremeum HHB9708 TaxID=1314777 RepID=A0A164XKS8_9AGAM|nr:DUF423-domain-containing protein [Sistotremastrum niveocremeum HHB9708]